MLSSFALSCMLLALLFAPTICQTCNGPSITTWGNSALIPSNGWYYDTEGNMPITTFAVLRSLSSPQTITSVSAGLGWMNPDMSTNNITVNARVAIYTLTSNCSQGGEPVSVLLGSSSVYSLAAGVLSNNFWNVHSIPLSSPITVAAGQYVVSFLSDNRYFGLPVGATNLDLGGIYHDVLYNDPAHTPMTFRASTVFTSDNFYWWGYDAKLGFVGSTCTGSYTLTTVPQCSAIVQNILPSGAFAAGLPCANTTQFIADTVYDHTYDGQVELSGQSMRLVPVTFDVTQTIYELSFVVHPVTGLWTNDVPTYHVRFGLYNISSYNSHWEPVMMLLAQTAQIAVNVTDIMGRYTWLTMPLSTPLHVTAGTTLWEGRLVDEDAMFVPTQFNRTGIPGFVLENSAHVLFTNISLPITIQADRNSTLAIAHAVFGCSATAVAPASSTSSPSSSSAIASSTSSSISSTQTRVPPSTSSVSSSVTSASISVVSSSSAIRPSSFSSSFLSSSSSSSSSSPSSWSSSAALLVSSSSSDQSVSSSGTSAVVVASSTTIGTGGPPVSVANCATCGFDSVVVLAMCAAVVALSLVL